MNTLAKAAGVAVGIMLFTRLCTGEPAAVFEAKERLGIDWSRTVVSYRPLMPGEHTFEICALGQPPIWRNWQAW